MKWYLSLSTAIVVGVTTAAWADTLHYEAFLDGLQEVPPVATPATGTATAILDTATNTLCVHLEFSGLIGSMTAAHVHGLAPPGVNAGVIFALTLPPPSDTCGVLTDAQEQGVIDGLTYANVHSSFRPGGEIRGQLNKVPEPATLALLGLGGLVLIRRRR
jgi:hypothetical protein